MVCRCGGSLNTDGALSYTFMTEVHTLQIFHCYYKLSSHGGAPWTKKLYAFLQRTQTVKGSHFKAWSKSEFSHVCYAYCQEYIPQWDTVDAEIKILSAENLELTNILPLKPGAGWNIPTHTSTTARNSLLVLHSASFHLYFSPDPLCTFQLCYFWLMKACRMK